MTILVRGTERETRIDHAVDRIGYLVVSYGLLVIVAGGFGVTSELPEAAAAGPEKAAARSRARRGPVAVPTLAPAT